MQSDPESDDALVLAAVSGDRAAFAELHHRYAGMVHGICLARVPAQQAADLVQDTFVAALAQLSGLADRARFGPWIAAIARNRVTDHHRRRRTVVELPETLAAPARPTAEAAQVMRIIRELPETYAETLTLRLVEGLTGPEIAQRTGKTHGSVRVNLHRGMALLRERLGTDG